jgi:hypothetical protein
MLRISWFEFIVRGIPEEFLFVLAVHAFSKTGINLKKYLLSGTLFWVSAYLIRLLPIQYGINTILSLIALIVIVNFINKIDIIKSIRAGLIVVILQFVFEGINLILIQFMLKIDLKSVMSNPISKTLYGIPSVILFGIFVIAYYIRLSKRKELKYI